MERWVAKVIAIIISFVLPFFFTMLPRAIHNYVSSKGKTGERVISYLMCFGGGIFFGTYLLHMSPESHEILSVNLLDPNEVTYPVTDLITGVGFFFVFFLEKIVMKINKWSNQRKIERLLERSGMYSNTIQQGNVAESKECQQNCSEPCEVLTVHVTAAATGCTLSTMDSQNGRNRSTCVEVCDVTKYRDSIGNERSSSDEVQRQKEEWKDGREEEKDGRENAAFSSSSFDHIHVDIEAHGHSHSHGHAHNQAEEYERNHHNMRSLILVMAISLHHIFEGLSVGLQHSAEALTTLMIAIMCHESIVGFSVGMTFIKCKYTLKRHLLTAFLVCLIMPIGEAIGTVMSETGTESIELEIASGILMAFSSGTFIFVTFFEILHEEIDPHDTSISKVFFVFVGFSTMACLMLIPEESPETDHESFNSSLYTSEMPTTYSVFSL